MNHRNLKTPPHLNQRLSKLCFQFSMPSQFVTRKRNAVPYATMFFKKKNFILQTQYLFLLTCIFLPSPLAFSWRISSTSTVRLNRYIFCYVMKFCLFIQSFFLFYYLVIKINFLGIFYETITVCTLLKYPCIMYTFIR